ncbi:hypothetical protein ACQCT5_04745 [Sutcliffiella halmapala]
MKKLMVIVCMVVLVGCNEDSSSSTTVEDKDCDIKGNLTTYNGEKIYHVPGGQFYDVTDPEEWFCSASEAEDAGYRKSKR